jgi:type IV pilus assembly protein PilO
MNTGLEGKPWYYGLIAGVVVAAVIGVIAQFTYFSPKKEEIKRKEAELEKLQDKIQEGRAAQQKLPQFREEVQRLELELEKLLRILPAKRNTPDLIRRISALTEQGDFNLKLFKPGQLSDKDFYSEWPIQIELDGNYHNLALFFDRISRFSRIINVDDLKIDALHDQTPTQTITVKFTAKTFVYKEPEEGAEGESAAGAKAATPAKPVRRRAPPRPPAPGDQP